MKRALTFLTALAVVVLLILVLAAGLVSRRAP